MKKMLCLILMFAGFANAAAYVISDGYHFGTTYIENSDSLLVTGGGLDFINASDYGLIVVQNTAPYEPDKGGIGAIDLYGWSSLEIYGGEINNLHINGNSTASLYGGSIEDIYSYQNAYSQNVWTPHIEIICRDYDDTIANLVTGTWDVDNDGDGFYDTFSIELKNQDGYDPVIDNIKFTIIPEPCSLILLGLGGFLVKRR